MILNVAAIPGWQKRLFSGIILAPVVLGIVWKGGALFVAALILLAAIAINEWVHLARRVGRPVLLGGLGAIYIALSFRFCFLIRDHHPLKVSFLFLVMIWTSDIGAYIAGKAIGGAKMSPAISPNKTWAGFAGATILPGIAGAIYILIYNMIYESAVFPYDLHKMVFVYTGIGMLTGFVGQAGDLLVSWLKRSAQVKDAGELIPGHGGLLDRVDALMLAAPVYLWIVTKYPNVFPG